MKRLEGARRHEILQLLGDRTGLLGVELGVAGGGFSARMVETGRFSAFFGVDMYADDHDVNEYKQALRRTGLFSPYKLLRMSFAEAYDLFEDESLDFIYVDGYAGSGAKGGQTIWQWARKVKIGGLVAGDDYHESWPLVIEAVNAFADATGFDLHVTTVVEPGVDYSDYPSWGMIKTEPVTGAPPAQLALRGDKAEAMVVRKHARSNSMKRMLRTLIGDAGYARLRRWKRGR